MKNKFMQTVVGTLLGLVMLIGGAQILVSGQRGFVAQERGIVGVFQTTITPRNCQTGNPIATFIGLLTFNQGGTLAETSAALSPALRTPGHGVWSFEPNFGQYSIAFTFLRFNPDGTFAGRTVVRQTSTLAPGGNELHSSGTTEVYGANGNLLGTGCASSVATRFE